jgi:hypothetical protein
MANNYDYDRASERDTAVDLQRRWTEFMRYTNSKTKTIDSTFLREYANFVSNVALRFGAITALANCPEVPNEVLGNIVRDYERELVTWSKHLAGIERREADFRKRLAEVRNAENSVGQMAGPPPPMATSTRTLGYAAVQECPVPNESGVTISGTVPAVFAVEGTTPPDPGCGDWVPPEVPESTKTGKHGKRK